MKREENVNIALSTGEAEIIRSQAIREGLTPASYMRRVVLVGLSEHQGE